MADDSLLRDERPKHYPHCHAELAEQGDEPRLARRLALRPGRFPVGLDEPGRPLQPPRDEVRGTPLTVEAYVARVERVGEDDEVLVRAWVRPSGGEELMVLSTRSAHFDREPAYGDLLWIWKWTDVFEEAGNTKKEPRVHVEVERKELDDDDRARIRELLLTLEEDE